jgi:ubiquinone/menaquinone biosynthesis C-methylase UbiE
MSYQQNKNQKIKEFWDAHPCGEELLPHESTTSIDFFNNYDGLKQGLEPHITAELTKLNLKDVSVLEIGLGQGMESEFFIKSGAIWTGIDVSTVACERVLNRIRLKNLNGRVINASATELPFNDSEFDLVFSHGVLHHIPDVEKAAHEMSRVLSPGGKLIVMVYSKYSINYLFSILIIRRIGLGVIYPLYLLGIKFEGKYLKHLENLHNLGFQYLRADNFLSANTDGPENPYSKVYSAREAKKMFPSLTHDKTRKFFRVLPPFYRVASVKPKKFGWHLWVHFSKSK